MADTVAVGYVHDDADITASFLRSYQSLLMWHLANPQAPQIVAEFPMQFGTDGLPGARNRVVEGFLESDADWLFWVDCDMGFSPDTIDALHRAAHPQERPAVGALCFSMKQYDPDGYGGWRTEPRPTLYSWVTNHEGNRGFMAAREYPRDAVVRCDGTGSAAILIHRSAFETIGEGWYDKTKVDGTVQAEDLSFCMRLAANNVPLHVHTGVKTTHVKQVWTSEEHFLTSTWPAPATEPVAVIVPALNRPGNVPRFMHSLRASTGLATAYWICDEDDHDQIAAVKDHGGTVIINDAPHRSFACKANVGYRHTTEPWMLLVGDDVVFRPGWYDRAVRAAGSRFHMVATNDGGNEAVLAGEHATHPLIRRTWVDEHGASWDGPGTVCHEGYRHWWVDSEWTAVARLAGAFVYAPDAVVEHLHPQFGKSDMDDTYRKGASNKERDERLFRQRLRKAS